MLLKQKSKAIQNLVDSSVVVNSCIASVLSIASAQTLYAIVLIKVLLFWWPVSMVLSVQFFIGLKLKSHTNTKNNSRLYSDLDKLKRRIKNVLSWIDRENICSLKCLLAAFPRGFSIFKVLHVPDSLCPHLWLLLSMLFEFSGFLQCWVLCQ